MLGGLHIEIAYLSVLGDWLIESGWSVVMEKAKISTQGKIDDLLKGSKTSRAQWAHQISLATLHILIAIAHFGAG